MQKRTIVFALMFAACVPGCLAAEETSDEAKGMPAPEAEEEDRPEEPEQASLEAYCRPEVREALGRYFDEWQDREWMQWDTRNCHEPGREDNEICIALYQDLELIYEELVEFGAAEPLEEGVHIRDRAWAHVLIGIRPFGDRFGSAIVDFAFEEPFEITQISWSEPLPGGSVPILCEGDGLPRPELYCDPAVQTLIADAYVATREEPLLYASLFRQLKARGGMEGDIEDDYEVSKRVGSLSDPVGVFVRPYESLIGQIDIEVEFDAATQSAVVTNVSDAMGDVCP